MSLIIISNVSWYEIPSGTQWYVGFRKQFIMDNLAGCPAGTYLSLFTKYEGMYLIAMGYKYNKKVTYFIATLWSGTTCYMNQPCIQMFTDNFGNICEKLVMRKDLASFYLKNSIVIHTHNNERPISVKIRKNGKQRIHSSESAQP